MKYTLRNDGRIKSRKGIRELFDAGRSFSVFPFRVIWLVADENDGSPVKILVSVARKKWKRAVDRNRIKRLIREAYRLNSHILSDVMKTRGKQVSVALIFIGEKMPVYKLTEEKIILILQRLAKRAV